MTLRTIDDFLLDLLQRFSDWTHELFGINNFWWARIFSSLTMFTLSLMGVADRISLFISLVLPLFMLYRQLTYISELEEKTIRDLDKGCANGEIKYASTRLWLLLTFLFLLPLIDRFAYLVSFQFFLILSMYFTAGTPKPPSKSKLRKLWESLTTSSNQLLVPA